MNLLLMFDTNYEKIALNCLRPDHRDSNQRSLMQAQSAGMETMNARFALFREKVDYILKHDSRKTHIEKVLNDQFDDVERRIYIDNVEPNQGVYFYNIGDDRPVFHYDFSENRPVYYYETANVDVANVNFVVYLPNAIKPLTDPEVRKLDIKINSQINRYKVDSKNHKLLWID